MVRGVPREPQEPILVEFWTILESFWVPSGHLGAFLERSWEQPAANSSKDRQIATKSEKKQQKEANSSKLKQTAASISN